MASTKATCAPWNRPDGVLLRLYAIRVAMHFHFHQLTLRQPTQDGG